MVECEELGIAMETSGERGIATYLVARFVDHRMFPQHYVIEELSTSSMWSTIDRLDMLVSVFRFDITHVVGVFGYMPT